MSTASVLGIIPARGGSKAVPRKNLAPVFGKPLISYTIDAALAARSLGDVVVSTEDPEIADVARRGGARVPFVRPAPLASDTAKTFPVIAHALTWLAENEGAHYELVVVLQPTAPLRLPEDIDAAVAALRARPEAESLVSLVAVDDPHPYKMKALVDGWVRPFLDPSAENVGMRRQDCPEAYALNGAIYIAKVASLLQRTELLAAPVLPFVMPRGRSVNVDSELDLQFAEFLLSRRSRGPTS
jgi:CMP-N,N'-diacetyllegionaminic acid synthase